MGNEQRPGGQQPQGRPKGQSYAIEFGTGRRVPVNQALPGQRGYTARPTPPRKRGG